MWFQSDPNRLPDSEFEPGALRHLCEGNEGRRLDFRRTPVRIEKLCDETGLATVQILAFEDRGAIWDLPYEEIGKYQFRKGSATASPAPLKRIADAIDRFDREVELPCDPARKNDTLEAIARERESAHAWLTEHSQFFRTRGRLPDGEPDGSPLLWNDTKTYLAERGLGEIEEFFTRQYVTYMLNESVKAHRLAIAQLGLAPYKGKILRDPRQTCDARALDCRADHVRVRMGLVQAIFELCNQRAVVLYRMESCEGRLRPRQPANVLVSASFRLDIVQEMAGWADPHRTVVIYRQQVPVERLLMTYFETEAMNRPFREAEAVLLADPGNEAF